MQRKPHNTQLSDKPSTPNFVSVGIGTGVYTGNFNTAGGAQRYTFIADASFGHWFNHASGVHAGISNSVVQHWHKRHNQNLTAIHADYMLNIKSAVTGEPTEDQLFQLTGLAGVQMGISSESGRKTRLAPALNGAIQAGMRLSPSIEIYLEPSATIYTKKIEAAHSEHPADGELRLSIGTKLHF